MRIVGLGLGVWAISKDIQTKLFVKEFIDVLISSKNLQHVVVVDFAWFYKPLQKTSCKSLVSNNTFDVLYSENNPATKLDKNYENCLLVCSYAWDGNSFPGNEYWIGALSASGDPAGKQLFLI